MDEGSYRQCQEVLTEIKKKRAQSGAFEFNEGSEEELERNFLKLNGALAPYAKEHATEKRHILAVVHKGKAERAKIERSAFLNGKREKTLRKMEFWNRFRLWKEQERLKDEAEQGKCRMLHQMILITQMHAICSKLKTNVKDMKAERRMQCKKLVKAEFIVQRTRTYFKRLGVQPKERLRNDIR